MPLKPLNTPLKPLIVKGSENGNKLHDATLRVVQIGWWTQDSQTHFLKPTVKHNFMPTECHNYGLAKVLSATTLHLFLHRMGWVSVDGIYMMSPFLLRLSLFKNPYFIGFGENPTCPHPSTSEIFINPTQSP